MLLVSIAAGAVGAVSGFGVGSLITPLLLLGFPAHQAVALVAIPHLLASGVRLLRLEAEVDRRTFVQFGIASAVGGLVGALLQPTLKSGLLTALLGVLMLLAGITELLRRPIPLPAAPAARLLAGGLSGLFGGLVGNQGGIRSAALLGFGLSPARIVATATASAVLVDLARVPIYAITSGPAIAAEVPLLAAASAGVVLGTLIGVPLLRRIPERVYRPLVGTMLVVLATSLLTASFR